MGSAGENFCLRWNEFESNISSSFKELREESDFFDVTLGCSDSNGRSLQAHKVILSACSVFFKQMLREQQHSSLNHPNPYIYLRGVSYGDLSSILDFMYHGEVNVAQEDLNSFLSVAEELQIKGLTNKEGDKEPATAKKPVRKPDTSSSAPAVKRARRSSPGPSSRPEPPTAAASSSEDVKAVVDIKSDPDPEAGPSAAVTGEFPDDDQGDFGDYGDGDYTYGDNGAEGESMLEADVTNEGEDGAGGKDMDPFANASGVAATTDGAVCLDCGKAFKTLGNAKRHNKEKHLSNPDVTFKCKFCNKEFKVLRFRNEHLSKFHGINLRSIKKVVKVEADPTEE